MRLEYTEQAQEVLAVMEETAHQMKFSYIGTEHLLYGMLSCPWVTAWKILAENGADESFVLKYLEQNSGTKKIKTLVYSDNTEKLLDKADTRYTWSIEHEDETKEEGIITRTYRVRVTELSTGNTYEATQSVDFGKEEPVSIKTEEMTTVIVEGNKWVMVQSTPSITGIYSMNSSKLIDCMYYASDNEAVVCAGDTFKLEEGVTYQFLIKLK